MIINNIDDYHNINVNDYNIYDYDYDTIIDINNYHNEMFIKIEKEYENE